MIGVATHASAAIAGCAATGQAKILNTVRQLVALHKDRSVFPISLAVQKLSGIGSDSIFMAIVRTSVADDETVVKVCGRSDKGLHKRCSLVDVYVGLLQMQMTQT